MTDQRYNRFQQLYNGYQQNKEYCMGTNVGNEYICPKIDAGHIEEMPLNPWFASQTQYQTQLCHPQQTLLGKYNLCSNQYPSSNLMKQSQTPQSPQVPQVPQVPQPQSPQPQQPQPPQQTGGYVFTNYPSRNPYENFPAQQGYRLKRCIGDRNLYPNRQMGYDQSFPPLMRQVRIQSEETPEGSEVSIAGSQPILNYLVVATPLEATNRFMMNPNITSGYYPNLVADPIANRPVYTARNLEAQIPEILLHNKPNLLGYDAGCHQPYWTPRCI